MLGEKESPVVAHPTTMDHTLKKDAEDTNFEGWMILQRAQSSM